MTEPRFDAGRSAEIRDLLTTTVRDTPPPRVARLSRPAFALAASVALLVAGGLGAGGAVAIDAYVASNVLVQQDSGASSSDAAGSAEGMSGDSAASPPQGLVPFLTVEGENGFAYSSDITAAQAAAAAAVAGDSESGDAANDTAEVRIPIFRADGTSVIGFYVPIVTP